MEWPEAAAPTITVAEARVLVPIPFVLEQAGLSYELHPDDKIHALCPWHNDSDPSLDVFGENWDRWGCYPCGIGGDVLDLMQRLDLAKGFTAALFLAESYASQIADTQWRPPRAAQRVNTLDLDTAARLVSNSWEDLRGLGAWLEASGLPFDAGQLRAAWGVGSIGEQVIIPFWDAAGALVTYKYRSATSKPYSAAGGRHTAMYGEWRDDRSLPALITEGESDAWAASYWLRGRVSVLGLPSGSGTPPEQFADRFEGRVVILAFDGDEAGWKAQDRWGVELTQRGALVRFLPVPPGQDLRGLGQLLSVLDLSRL